MGSRGVQVNQEDYDAAQVYADFYSESDSYSLQCHQRLAEQFARHRQAAYEKGKEEGLRIANSDIVAIKEVTIDELARMANKA